MLFNTKEIQTALSVIAKLQKGKSSMPVANSVKLDAGKLVATDINNVLTVHLSSDEPDTSTIILSTSTLNKIVKGSKDSHVRIASGTENKVEITLDGIKTKVFQNLAVEDFIDTPIVENEKNYTLKNAELVNVLDWTLRAVSTNPRHLAIQNVAFGQRNPGEVCATDDHRLNIGSINTDFVGLILGHSACVLKQIAEITGQDVIVTENEKDLRFVSGDWALVTHKPDCTFPQYGNVLPNIDKSPIRLNVNAKTFLKVLDRVVKVSESNEGKFTITENEVTLSCGATDNEAETTVGGTLTFVDYEPGTLKVGVNLDYLRDATLKDNETVELRFDDDASPIAILGSIDHVDNVLAIVMPIRT